MSDEQKYTIEGLDEYIRQRNRIMHVGWGKVADDTSVQSANKPAQLTEQREQSEARFNSAESRWKSASGQSAKLSDGLPPKCKNCTLEEVAVLRIMHENPSATQKEIATAIGKSERTVKTITVAL